jgi:DNA-binding PadR family transcriptional regulator
MPAAGSKIPDILPLREPTFYILLSLSTEDRHGYAILKDVEELSQGKLKLSTGTLYEAIARLLDQGLIERIPGEEFARSPNQESRNHPGKPRKAYRLTPTGRRVLEAETTRLQRLVEKARLRLAGGKP